MLIWGREEHEDVHKNGKTAKLYWKWIRIILRYSDFSELAMVNRNSESGEGTGGGGGGGGANS